MNPQAYCREVESYLCRKNDGHLIRVVGPSFDLVSQWAAIGIPLKIVCAGIDRYFERYHRQKRRRRPVRIDFCAADVLEMYDEWRRVAGIVAFSATAGPARARVRRTRRARRMGGSCAESGKGRVNHVSVARLTPSAFPAPPRRCVSRC